MVLSLNAADAQTVAAVAGLRFPEVTGRHVLVAGASRNISTNALETACSRIILMTRIPVKWAIFANHDGTVMEVAEKSLKAPDVAAVVLAMDAAGGPSLMAMPEQRIVALNPTAWLEYGVGEAAAEQRSIKMIERGFCAAMGATLAPVFSTKDLDNLRSGIAPSVMTSIFRYGKALGLERMKPE